MQTWQDDHASSQPGAISTTGGFPRFGLGTSPCADDNSCRTIFDRTLLVPDSLEESSYLNDCVCFSQSVLGGIHRIGLFQDVCHNFAYDDKCTWHGVCVQVEAQGTREVLRPVKADAKIRKSVGAETVLTPVRRSTRTSMPGTRIPSLAEQLKVRGLQIPLECYEFQKRS